MKSYIKPFVTVLAALYVYREFGGLLPSLSSSAPK